MYMIKRPRRPGQSWETFPRNHAVGIASTDLLVVPMIDFKLLYGLVILDHGRRRLIHYAVTAYPTSEWAARQFVEAFPWDQTSTDLMRDRDGVYGAVVKRRPRGLGILDRPIAPRCPWQNAYMERFTGSIRRECIDHVIILGEAHLRRIMSAFDAVFVTNNLMTVGAMKALDDLAPGLRDKVGIVTFDLGELALVLRNLIASVNQDAHDMGRLVGERILLQRDDRSIGGQLFELMPALALG
jgi:transposase InsO family protein